MKHNQLGFNNFKSFGERIQMFSDKPITLIYGANSVGKSSFLHAQLYREYLKRSRSIEFERSDFAGDELELDGFSEFVHKKDTSNKISFRKIVSSPRDLDMILGNGFSKIKEFAKEGIIKEALSLDRDEFVRRLNNYKLKEDEWLFTDSSREHQCYPVALGICVVTMISKSDFQKTIKEKIKQYTDTGKARDWLDSNLARVKQLFENYTLRDFIFEPFQSVFQTPSKTIDANIYSVITQVAIINMVLAGLPGKMGVGVWVSVALEGWMAYSIARHVGVNVSTPSDIWKYVGMLAASMGVILYGLRILIGFAFSAFSMIPWINPLIFAELVVTDLVGILFWIGFLEVSSAGSFSIPKRMWFRIGTLTKELVFHQGRLLKNVFNKENIKIIGVRLRDYLKGEFPVDQKIINGETFATAAMAYLIAGHYEKLQGPLGEIFIEAVRLRWSSQFDENASIEEIADAFREYDADQIDGVINTIKGKMFEIMVTEQENLDGDNWIAKMNTDETFPGSDIVFTDIDTGESIEVSLKAVSVGNEGIIEHALARYPDIPIMTTDEMAELYGGDERVFGSQILHEDLDDITNDRFDELVSSIEQVNAHKVVVGGVTMGVIAVLWPFVVAYLRNRITREQLDKVFKKALGDSGVKLASRLGYATIFGPLFAWYLLARGVKGLVMVLELKNVKYIEYIGA